MTHHVTTTPNPQPPQQQPPLQQNYLSTALMSGQAVSQQQRPSLEPQQPAVPTQTPELYSLKWNDYVHNLQSVFKYLRDSDEFSDVTIACLEEDGSSQGDGGGGGGGNNGNGIVCFRAHRIILAACSGFFQRVLGGGGGGGGSDGGNKREQRYNTPTSTNPIVYLKDVRPPVFKNILNFVYYGEVQVANTDLPEFLSVAASLKIKGLVRTPNEHIPQLPPQQIIPLSQPQEKRNNGITTPPPPPLAPLPQPIPLRQEPRVVTPTPPSDFTRWGATTPNPQSNSVPPVAPQPPPSAVPSASSEDEDKQYYDSHESFSKFFKSHEEQDFVLKSPYGSRIRATDPRPCPKCGKIYRSAHTLRTHLEDKHTICPGYRCVLCGTVAKSRNSLHSHMSRQHRGISTKDLPVIPMPAPFDPELANRLLAKVGGAKVELGGGIRGYERIDEMEDMEDDEGQEGSDADEREGREEVEVEQRGQRGIGRNTRRSSVGGGTTGGEREDGRDKPQKHGQSHNNTPRHPSSTSSSPAALVGTGSGSAILDTYLQLIAENSSAVFAAAAAAAAAAAGVKTPGGVPPTHPPPPGGDEDETVAKKRKQDAEPMEEGEEDEEQENEDDEGEDPDEEEEQDAQIEDKKLEPQVDE